MVVPDSVKVTVVMVGEWGRQTVLVGVIVLIPGEWSKMVVGVPVKVTIEMVGE